MGNRQQLSETWLPEVLIVKLEQQVSSFSDSNFLQEMEEIGREFHQSERRHIVIDFSKVPHFGSSVLEGIFILWNEVKLKKGELRLCNLSPIGREIVEISRFDILWPMHDSCNDAINAIAS